MVKNARLVSQSVHEGTEPCKKPAASATWDVWQGQAWVRFRFKSQRVVRADGTHGPLSFKFSSLLVFPISGNDDSIQSAMLTRYLEDIFNHPLQEIPYPVLPFLPPKHLWNFFLYTATPFIQAIIIYPDKNNSFLNGLPASTLVPFHSVFYKTMRMIFSKCSSLHVTSL